MTDNKDTLGKNIRDTFQQVSKMDRIEFETEILSELFVKTAENLESELFDKFGGIVNGHASAKDLRKAIVRAEMEGEAPIFMPYPAPPSRPYMLSNPPVPQKLTAMEGYISIHRICKKLDIEVMLDINPAQGGKYSFMLIIIPGAQYASMKNSAPLFYPDLEEKKEAPSFPAEHVTNDNEVTFDLKAPKEVKVTKKPLPKKIKPPKNGRK